jgi:antitoxin PrlF
MLKAMHESKVTSKWQTILPRDVRSVLGLEAGDTLRYIVEDGRVQILKARRVTELAGMLRRAAQPRVALAEMDAAAAQGAVDSTS